MSCCKSFIGYVAKILSSITVAHPPDPLISRRQQGECLYGIRTQGLLLLPISSHFPATCTTDTHNFFPIHSLIMSSSSNESISSSVFSGDNLDHRDDSRPSSVSSASTAGSQGHHPLHESNSEPTSSVGSPAASINSQESQRQVSRHRRRGSPGTRVSRLRDFAAMMRRRTARHSGVSDTTAQPGTPFATSTNSQISQSSASQLWSSARPREDQGGLGTSR
jgi:hypothetical protein